MAQNFQLGTFGQYVSADASSNSVTFSSNTLATTTNTFTIGTGSYFVSNGNVGIGTTAPSFNLHIKGSTVGDVRSEATTYAKFSLNVSGAGTNAKRWQQYAFNGGLTFSALNDAENAETPWLNVIRGSGTTISYVYFPNGNIGIGTATPSASLNITKQTTALSGTSNPYGLYIYPTSSGTCHFDALNSNPNGADVKIRTFNGSTIYTNYFTQAGAAYQGNDSSTWSQYSDIRIKTNIRPISSPLQKITSLKPCHFETLDSIGQVKTGFIAQEFEEVFPGHVGEQSILEKYKPYLPEDVEKIKTVDPNLTPYLVAAIKELKIIIEDLTNRIQTLENN